MSKTLIPTFVPSVLASRRQWVCWAERPRAEGKFQKIPINPLTGKAASVINPSNWGTLGDALIACRKLNLAGIGFIFTAEDPFVGIDLDDCRDPDTGQIEEWARDIIETLNSYTEVSPSGTGAKIFLKGELPSSVKGKSIEMYDRGRFFTVTRWHLKGTPRAITKPDPEILMRLHKESKQLQATRKPTRPRGKSGSPSILSEKGDQQTVKGAFRQLFDGDTVGKPSFSEADFGLVVKLARLTNCNPDQVDALFRQSGLFREKWDRPYSDGSTYGQRTIQKAIALLKRSL